MTKLARSVVEEELLSLYERDGDVTPNTVVERATPVDSPLHPWFEWDDSVAAQEHRLEQARVLIRSYKVEFVSPKNVSRSIRGFVSLPTDRVQTPGAPRRSYQPTMRVLSDEEKRAIVLKDLRRDIASLMRKYSHLEEFVQILLEEAGITL